MKTIAILTTLGILSLGLVSCNSTSPPPSASPSPSSEASQAQTQATLKIVSSSSISTILKLLAAAYQAQTPGIKVEFIGTSQSGGSIVAVKNDLADVAGSSHKLKPGEDNGQLQYREFARDLLMVATHRSVTGVTNLTTEQLRAIYQGKITNWQELGGPNATIVVLDRPEDESAKKLLRKYYLDQTPTTPNAILLAKETELIQTLQDTPSAIGAFSLAYAVINQLDVNRLSLNGVAPTIENFNQGKYLMVRQMGLVWDKKPSAETQKFIDFIFSSQGSAIIQQKGFMPALSPI